MDASLKQKALQNLAGTAGETAEAAVRKELAKIVAILQSESQYSELTEQLELLDIIAYRAHNDALVAVRDFLERVADLELTHEEIEGYPAEQLREFQTKDKLVIKALTVLRHIRYHNPSEILEVFFEYSDHKEESVAKEAMTGIKELAEYNLDIFYGDGKDWGGLAWEPQEKVLEKVSGIDERLKRRFFSGIIAACDQILSPTITGTSSTYKTFTWRTGAVPALDGIKDVRKKALDILKSLYSVATNAGEKKAVLISMETATRTPHTEDYGDDVLTMVLENTIDVVEFMKSIAHSGDLQVMQKVEHDAYWLLYHRGKLDRAIRKALLEIRDILYADEEYSVFRILIGFESIFHDWEQSKDENNEYEREKEYRESETLKLAEGINAESYEEWRERIIRYARIESNDLATFPYFGQFLRHFAKTSPALAMQLLSDASEELQGFVTSILCGVVETDRKDDLYQLIEKWCHEGRHLVSLARFFEFSPEVNEEVFEKILNRAMAEGDTAVLNQIVASVSAQYGEDRKDLVERFFIPALQKLTERHDSGWLFGFWFRKERGPILAGMDPDGHKAVLDNLFWLRKIDYHAEEVLSVLAKQSPALVIEFFCKRLAREKDEAGEDRYEAIPYTFHKLSKPLSEYPAEAMDAVRAMYDGNYGLFIYRGARLLKNIFPDFPAEFQKKLLETARTGEKDDLLFVLAILRNYDGSPVIQNICKDLVKISPKDDSILNEVDIILRSTGVVSGEYGFVNAYEKKIEEIEPWLSDDSSVVREFAKRYVSDLRKSIEWEQKRADEDIALRKHWYGTDDQSS